MNKSTKIVISILIVVVGVVVYFTQGSKPQITSISTNTDQVSTTTHEVGSAPIDPLPTKPDNNSPTGPSTKPSTPNNLKIYKGEFFPFEFEYPSNLVFAKNQSQSTKDLEKKTFAFNRLAFNGGIGGYVTVYATHDDDSRYDDLTSSNPEAYKKIMIGGSTFYRHIEAVSDTNNKGFRVEYITSKDGGLYRLSLIVVNGDNKVLDIKTYEPEFTMIESIAKSLKIN